MLLVPALLAFSGCGLFRDPLTSMMLWGIAFIIAGVLTIELAVAR